MHSLFRKLFAQPGRIFPAAGIRPGDHAGERSADALGISEGSLINLIIEPLEVRPRLDPQLRAAMELALDDVEPGLHYLKG